MKKTIRDLALAGKRVLARVDFNVPVDIKDGIKTITDETRIQATLPTLKYLKEQGAKIILMAHLGRPKGAPEDKFSLKPVADRLGEIFGGGVHFAEDCVGDAAEKAVAALKEGEILLLENVRFHAGETKNDDDLAKGMAKLADVYVNDAFGTAHRAHSSTEGVARHAPESAIGFLMEKELQFLGDELNNPKRPFVVILGGAKVSDKIGVIDTLLDKADSILIGGAMAYTFALAMNKKIGGSLSEPDKVDVAKEALAKAEAKGVKMALPIDTLITNELDFDNKKVGETKFTAPGEDIPDGWQGVDIGPETIKAYAAEVAGAKTILWNGPMGVFEIEACSKGTFAIAEAIAGNADAVSVIGGGDSVKAINRSGYGDKVTHLSTGGGASLEFLEGKTLPGVAIIPEK